MKKLFVQITWDKNYGAACDELPGCIATHSTLSGVKDTFIEAIEWHLEAMQEDGENIPAVFSDDYEIHFHLNIRALLHHYEGVITRSALARLTGINERQLGHYAQGFRNPRNEQREKIINAIHNIAQEMLAIE